MCTGSCRIGSCSGAAFGIPWWIWDATKWLSCIKFPLIGNQKLTSSVRGCQWQGLPFQTARGVSSQARPFEWSCETKNFQINPSESKLCACTHAHMHTAHMHTHAHTHTHTHACNNAHKAIVVLYVQTNPRDSKLCPCTHAHMHACTHAHMYTHAYTHAHNTIVVLH